MKSLRLSNKYELFSSGMFMFLTCFRDSVLKAVHPRRLERRVTPNWDPSISPFGCLINDLLRHCEINRRRPIAEQLVASKKEDSPPKISSQCKWWKDFGKFYFVLSFFILFFSFYTKITFRHCTIVLLYVSP